MNSSLRLLARLTVACLVSSSFALAQSPCKTEKSDPSNDIVEIGLCGSNLAFSTARSDGTWRRKNLQLVGNTKVVDFFLSAGGTKLAVLTSDNAPLIFDLSGPVAQSDQHTHVLPRQTYELLDRLYDDHGRPVNDRGSVKSGFDSERFDSSGCRWKRFRVLPEPELYAPVFQFAAGEEVFPTRTDIWKDVGADTSKQPETLRIDWQNASRDAEENRKAQSAYQEYSRLADREPAVVYCRVRSLSGSWLIEYWTYYPFDVGGVGPHEHDTEHVFVEIDKIGGRILSILASAHLEFTPNNIFSASEPGARRPTLPIFVFVEKGKHAMAPDVDRDQMFTPGVDVNVGPELSQVWGIRDAIGQSDVHMLAYQSGMTFPRQLSHARGIETLSDYFPEKNFKEFAPIRRVYTLEEFPGEPTEAELRSQSCQARLCKAWADYKLAVHEDARTPNSIQKTWVFPDQQLRIGYTNIEGPNISIGYVSTINELPVLRRRLRLPVPGRVAFEALIGRTTHEVREIIDFTPVLELSSPRSVQGVRFFIGAQYEKSLTNMFGYFVGYFRRKEFVRPRCVRFCVVDSAPTQPLSLFPQVPPRFRQNFYQMGFYFELPRFNQSLHNMGFYLGPVFSAPDGLSGVFFRTSISVWRKRGRSRFGNPP